MSLPLGIHSGENLRAILRSYLRPLEPFFLFSAHRFFIMFDNRFLPAGVRWSRFFFAASGSMENSAPRRSGFW